MEQPTAQPLQAPNLMNAAVPTRALGLLIAIGFADLVMTAVLHAKGLIIEVNPIMRVLIDRSEWLFAVVKGGFLVFAWIVMANYAKKDLRFVRNACAMGSAVYLTVWISWMLGANL